MTFKKAQYKKELADSQLAILNVLEDHKKDSEDVLNSSKAIFNLLKDLEVSKDLLEKEKVKAENLVQELSKFKLAVDNAFDKITLLDKDSTVIYANNAVENVTGYSSDEVVGKKARVLWGDMMPEAFYEDLWRTISVDKKVFVSEMTNKRKNGEEYSALISKSPILDEGGEVMFFVGIERDITKEKEIDRAKTELVSLASHQLLTPLSIISWYSEMLLAGDAGEVTPKQKVFLDEIYAGNRRMIDLVNSLLNVSRMEMGTFVTNPEPTDLTKILKDVAADQKIKINKKDIKLSLVFGKDIPIMQTDQKYLSMVVENILSNAVKYTPSSGLVKLSLEYDAGNKKILLKVADNGLGIPKSEQHKIFGKLFRADNVREKNKIEGTGLGLYMVKAIVEQFRGRVWFESEENVGTTFFVELPVDIIN